MSLPQPGFWRGHCPSSGHNPEDQWLWQSGFQKRTSLATYRPQRLPGPCGRAPRRLPPNDLQPNPRRPSADGADHRGSQRVLIDSVEEESRAAKPRPGRAPASGRELAATLFPSVEERPMTRTFLSCRCVRRTRISCGFCRSAVYVGVVLAITAAPAAAQRHRARLSADLADHLAADSPAIEVIVDGDAASIARLAGQYNLVVKRSLRRGGAVLQVNAGQLAALQEDEAVDHLAGNVRYRSHPPGPAGRHRSRRDGGRHRRRPGVGRRGRPAAAVGAGRHGGGDRLGLRPAASRAQKAGRC